MKRSKQFFYQHYSNYDRKFAQSNREIANSSRPSTLFGKQFKDFVSFLKLKDFSKLALNLKPVQEP